MIRFVVYMIYHDNNIHHSFKFYSIFYEMKSLSINANGFISYRFNRIGAWREVANNILIRCSYTIAVVEGATKQVVICLNKQ